MDTHYLDNTLSFLGGVGTGAKNLLVDTATGLYRLATDPVETGKGVANTVSNADTLIYNGLMKSELDIMLGDYASATARDFEFIGGIWGGGALARTTTKGVVNGVRKLEANIIEKTTSKLPNNAVYNPKNGIISIENKNFIQVGTDTLTNSPILREIGYNKGSYALKGNHYVSTADGLYMIGKNALQRTGTKVITNSSLKDIMTPSINPISNMYYNGTNFAIRNSTKITDFINGYFIPGTPDYVFWGGVGALTNMGINYDTTIENFKNSYDVVKNSIIDFKNENFK